LTSHRSNDPCAPFSGGSVRPFPGSSIFVNSLTGVPPLGTYTTADSSVTVTITTCPSASSTPLRDGAAPVRHRHPLQVCDIGSIPHDDGDQQLPRERRKVLIFDADRARASLAPAAANYSTFLFPFTASTPGPQEQAASTRTSSEHADGRPALGASPVTIDSVTTRRGRQQLRDFNPTGAGRSRQEHARQRRFVEAYARTPNGGLYLRGEDFWFDFGGQHHRRHQRLVFISC